MCFIVVFYLHFIIHLYANQQNQTKKKIQHFEINMYCLCIILNLRCFASWLITLLMQIKHAVEGSFFGLEKALS